MPPIMPGQPMAGQIQKQVKNPLDEINGKLDAIMEHIGCEYKGDVNKDSYMNMSDEEKDKIDEKQVLGKSPMGME